MTHPHRWLRAAHKIAPNGALFPDISYYRLGCTERSRPFPTNLPEVRNRPIRLFYKKCRPTGGIPYLNSKLSTLNSKKGRSFLRNCVLFCAWLGRPDLNRRMEESKSSALPLGDGPVKIKNRAGALPTRFFGGVPREIRTLGLQSHNLAR